MAEYVSITNLYDLANAIRERNAIERDKLKFEKEVFEFNKQINLDMAKANVDMANASNDMIKKMNDINKCIDILAQNDEHLKKRIDELDFSVRNLQ